MKARKAIKKLGKVQDLLTEVLDQYNGAETSRAFLDSAKAAVAQAKTAIDSQQSATPAGKAAAAPEKPKQNRLSAAGRKRISMAAKKRWAEARKNAAGKRPAKAAG
jgi:hypothetical protein